MCGIAGFVAREGQSPCPLPVCEQIQATLARRGPDQRGLYTDGPAVLIHARLSVVDLVGGRQPMVCSAGERTCALVYNGELYNTEELREALTALGHTFTDRSDTQVLLHSYQEWGPACVDRFNGIFAFAIWEEAAQTLFFARDRIGVKPFFYTLTEQGFLFGSELKALLAHPAVEAELDLEGAAEVLLLGPGRTPGCGVFRGLKELPPATLGTFSPTEGLNLRRYWRLTDGEHTDTLEQTVEQVRFLVTDAIRRQLTADVPVCTFLSGGLDSSLISSIADRCLRERGQVLHTFSVDYVDNEKYFTRSHFQPNSDPDYIARMNDCLGAVHHRVVLDNEDVADALYAAVDARDLPGMADVDSSLLLFCGKIKEHATVALSGECADEIFGGYPWYRDKDIREQDGFPWAQSTAYRASFLRPELARQLDAEAFVRQRYEATLADSHILPFNSPLERRMKEMVNLNFDWFMQTLLDRKDRMSMYHGLEVRVPFCDWRIAEYLYRVPWPWKDYEGHEKGLLRKAMEGLLPQEVLWRKKSPYPKTHHPAYLQAVSAKLRQVLADPDAPLFRLVRRDALEELLTTQRATPWYGQLMTTPQTIAYFLQLNYWLERYQVKLRI